MALVRALQSQIVFFLLFGVALGSWAAAPSWNILAAESSLTFKGVLNDAPTSGSFKTFKGTINFDPQKLDESHIRIEVDMASVSTSYADIAETLKTPEWLEVKLFPKAVFETGSFTQPTANTFVALGTLTIRDIKLPVVLTFVQETNSDNRARIKGSTTLKRTAFGIGKGEWQSTSDVKDEVEVTFTITAEKKVSSQNNK